MKIKQKLAALALATLAVTGVGVAGAAPAQAHSYSFTTNCASGSKPKVIVTAPSYVYTKLMSGAVTMASGYGSWNKTFSGNITLTVSHANGEPSVDYGCYLA